MGSTDAIASLIAPSSSKVIIQKPMEEKTIPGSVSMSGLDVWGDMALGDGSATARTTVAIPVDAYNQPSSVPGFFFSFSRCYATSLIISHLQCKVFLFSLQMFTSLC